LRSASRRRLTTRRRSLAQFQLQFTDEPTITRIVWLFIRALLQPADLGALRAAPGYADGSAFGHIAAFEAIGGVPHEIFYDRMKTAVISEAEAASCTIARSSTSPGLQPKACRPYRAKTKGKVERPHRFIREDFFLARSFRNLDDFNAQLRHWLDTVANPRVHATTQRVVNEAFAEKKPHLKPLPLLPFRSLLKLERRVSHEGMVSVGGNLYSVPDARQAPAAGYAFG